MSQTEFEWNTSGRRVASSLGAVAVIACCAWAVSALSSAPLAGGPTVYARGVTIHDPLQAYQGFNLFIDPSRNPSQGQIVLLDMDGVEVQTWPSPLTGSDQAMHVEALPGGSVLAIFNRPMNGSFDLVEMDWNGSIVWQYQAPAGTTLHHDFERLPNGNTLVLASEEIVDPQVGPNTLADDMIQEIDMSGQVVWSWSTADHFDQMPYSDVERIFIWFANGQGKTSSFSFLLFTFLFHFLFLLLLCFFFI